MFILVDVFVEIANIEQERGTFAFMQVGQESGLNQSPEFPFTHAEIFSGLSGAKETVLGRGTKTHGAPA